MHTAHLKSSQKFPGFRKMTKVDSKVHVSNNIDLVNGTPNPKPEIKEAIANAHATEELYLKIGS